MIEKKKCGVLGFTTLDKENIDVPRSVLKRTITGSVSSPDGEVILNIAKIDDFNHLNMALICSFTINSLRVGEKEDKPMGVIVETKHPFIHNHWIMSSGTQPTVMGDHKESNKLQVTSIWTGKTHVVVNGHQMTKGDDHNSAAAHAERHNKNMRFEGVQFQGDHALVDENSQYFNTIHRIYKNEKSLTGKKTYDIAVDFLEVGNKNLPIYRVSTSDFHKIVKSSSHFVDLNEIRINFIELDSVKTTNENVAFSYTLEYQLMTPKTQKKIQEEEEVNLNSIARKPAKSNNRNHREYSLSKKPSNF